MTVQLELFSSARPPRPQRTDEAVFQLMIDRMMPRVMHWMDQQPDLPGSEFYEDVKRDLVSCLEDRGRQLDAWEAVMYPNDTCRWDMDRDSLDLFDEVNDVLGECHNDLIMDWVDRYNVKCRFNVNDVVRVNGRIADTVERVSKVITTHASYLIKGSFVNDEDVYAVVV